MTCPVIGYPPFNNTSIAAAVRSSGMYFQLGNGAIYANKTDNKVIVTVFNPGPANADACRVAFFWASGVYTNPTNFPGGSGSGYKNPTDPKAIPAYSNTTFSIEWSTAGCLYDFGVLYAQARIDGDGACAATPPVGSSHTDCNQVYNAADSLAFMPAIVSPGPGLGAAATRRAAARPHDPLHYAIGIVNSEIVDVKTTIAVRAADEEDRAFADDPRIQRLRKEGGRWLAPRSVAVGLGLERVVRVGPNFPRLGRVGVTSAESFAQLLEGDLGRAQQTELIGGETRQALLEILPSADARPKDFYAIDVEQRDDAGHVKGRCSVIVESGERPYTDE
jgi:hypothetical protein